MARRTQAESLTHLDERGRARMVDVGEKPTTRRTAIASGRVRVSAEAARAIREGTTPKGDVLAAARLAGIMAAKKTAELIPLCHPIALESVAVDVEVGEDVVHLRATARTSGKTGVEMEALTAVSAAALTVYDMLKAVDRGMVIEAIRLEEKTGGRRGRYVRDSGTANEPRR